MVRKMKFQSPTGMHDILPESQPYWRRIYDVCENLAHFYQFEKIDTPIVEDSQIFLKGIGLSSDIVEKQMFTFKTKGGDYLTLRPEGTAPVVRAFFEHGMVSLPQPLKLWYFGPFFRYEHPQSGRFRQFWQVGFEVLGEEGAVIDTQIIQIFYNLLKELKLKNLIVEINSIGDSQCRPYYKKLLVNYFKTRESALCSDCRRRLKINPLRILDCKEEKCQQVRANAPQMLDYLCEECKKHFKEVLEFLDEIELPYHLNPYLVRGLDYYTKTVFEIFEESEEGKQVGALGGGGRYDNLAKLLGGKNLPACGGAVGIERVISLMKARKIKQPLPPQPKIFLAQLGNLAKKRSLKLLEEFRREKILVAESLGRDSLKSQLSRANRFNIRYVLIIGQKEVLEGTIILRDMVSGKQEIVRLDKIVREIKKRLKK
jgi:histidyl-tRNA synthetase